MYTIEDFNPEAVVLDAGDFPKAPEALRVLDSGCPVVCCDGAAAEFIASRRQPWRIVGDCDSLPPELKEQYNDIVRHLAEQDTNDQTKAVRYLAERGMRRIAILGATGKREDHTLGNISLLLEYQRQGIEARIYTDHGVFIPVCGSCRFVCPVGTQVSVFNFGARGLRSEGLRWPLRDFDALWQGTLNETVAETFDVHARGSWLIFINYA